LDIPGSEVRLDGEKYVMVRESEILIRIEQWPVKNLKIG
jgi:co-chaperonin GroES (HSP10)